MSQFSGVYPILYAFYDQAGRLDDGLMRLQVDKCIAAGAHGIAVLGLVTEVQKLDVNERRHLVAVVGRAIDGRVPYAVTVGEQSVHGQIEFARMGPAAAARAPARRDARARAARAASELGRHAAQGLDCAARDIGDCGVPRC